MLFAKSILQKKRQREIMLLMKVCKHISYYKVMCHLLTLMMLG
ncbi:hypothetical protein ASJ78_03925 [Serratia marcescens]|nr:hypothetical protein ASJ78_03925 [Serratia marcescens]